MKDVDRLRSRTMAAIERGESSRGETRAQLERLSREEEAAAKRRAKDVIDTIPDMVEKAAKEGRKSVVVMRVDYLSDTEAKPTQLKLAESIVFTKCSEAGLRPKLVRDWDNGGMNSWHNIVIEWNRAPASG